MFVSLSGPHLFVGEAVLEIPRELDRQAVARREVENGLYRAHVHLEDVVAPHLQQFYLIVVYARWYRWCRWRQTSYICRHRPNV